MLIVCATRYRSPFLFCAFGNNPLNFPKKYYNRMSQFLNNFVSHISRVMESTSSPL
jgi:hypothetical protein